MDSQRCAMAEGRVPPSLRSAVARQSPARSSAARLLHLLQRRDLSSLRHLDPISDVDPPGSAVRRAHADETLAELAPGRKVNCFGHSQIARKVFAEMSLRQLLHQTPPWRAFQQPPKMPCLLSIFRALSILRSEASSEPPRQSPSVHVPLPGRLPCSSSDPLGSGFSIDVVDSDLWPVSFGLLSDTAWGNECPDDFEQHEDDELHDSDDEIDDMRQRKKLFYKLDRGSREFEENNVALHHRKRDKTRAKNPKECKEEQPAKSLSSNVPKLKEKRSVRDDDLVEVKRERVPTFNQMTDPYHHPFCLDIHVTKGSVRACFVHRVTSRVVTVAHSISKDMKFDLGSKKGKGMKACAAVGALLAKRAIEDDIHNAVYTPRKGDRIEGKIEVVLSAITENGVDVKVKLKQRKPIKSTLVHGMISPSDGQHNS